MKQTTQVQKALAQTAKAQTAEAQKQYVMPIHFKNGSTVATMDNFAMKARCNRLKREMKKNQNAPLKRWGVA